MNSGEAIANVDRHGVALVDSLLEAIDPIHGGFRGEGRRGIDAAAHQLLWRHYMVTGEKPHGEAVLASLRAICRHDAAYGPRCDQTLGDQAQMLELLSWVWRQCRCRDLRRCGERIATSVLTRLRVPGAGFAARIRGDRRDDTVRFDWNGLMLVALIEAGSVFERRDWLVAAREVFDEIVAHLGGADDAGRLDDFAMISRAAIRLFEAFGKRRYMDRAETCVAILDDAFRDPVHGGYRMRATEALSPASILDAEGPSGNAVMIGVLARLHALSDQPHYAARAAALVEAFHGDIIRSAFAGATAVANAQTLARPVAIKVAGDPKLEPTRELMRIALDFGLPDRLVLGPGAGDPGDANPKAAIRLGTRCLAPITDTARLRGLVAPGGFRNMLCDDAAFQDC